jgi:hypothetical protein
MSAVEVVASDGATVVNDRLLTGTLFFGTLAFLKMPLRVLKPRNICSSFDFRSEYRCLMISRVVPSSYV